MPSRFFANAWRRWCEFLALAAILAAGGALRFARLDSNPPGVFADEAEKAMNAWALRCEGQAFEFAPGLGGVPAIRWRRWPLFVDVMGVKTSAIYQWALAAICSPAEPPSPARMRAPAAAAGVAALGATYGLARGALGPGAALAAAGWLAISPWHAAFTRWALQGAFIPLFIALGMLGAIRGLRGRGAWLLLTGAGFGLAFHSYSGARPFVLAFGAVFLVAERKALAGKALRGWTAGGLALFALLAAPAAWMMASEGGTRRFAAISVFAHKSVWQGCLDAALNYARHYSPGFLILTGDAQPRHGVSSFGQLQHLEFVFALAGLWRIWRLRPPESRLILLWLALFPVGAALTAPEQNPHALRSIVALPLPQLLAGLGMVEAAERFGGRRAAAAWTAIGLALAASAAAFAYDLFVLYPRYSAFAWSAGFGPALAKARAVSELPEGRVAVSGQIALGPYLVLYYDGTRPEALRRRGWAALRADFPPPSPDFDSRAAWAALPKGTAFVAYAPQFERVDAAPLALFPERGQDGAEAPFYAVYKK